jgi:hypothetical protein
MLCISYHINASIVREHVHEHAELLLNGNTSCVMLQILSSKKICCGSKDLWFHAKLESALLMAFKNFPNLYTTRKRKIVDLSFLLLYARE